MNIANNNENSGQGNLPVAELPPVLARVPWLLSSTPSPTPQLAQDAGEASVDASLFQSHELIATADSSAMHWDVAPTRLRFDSPQKPLPQTAPTQAAPTTSESRPPAATGPAPVATPAPALRPAAPATRPVTSPGSEGITHLRFDPPETGQTEQPSPQIATADTASHQPSSWHEMIATVDNTLRQYNRVIMLAALLTAAGLMMLVLESQQPAADPTSNEITPASMPSDSMMQPMPLAESSTEPAAVPERIAMAEGPQSSKPRLASTPSDSTPDTTTPNTTTDDASTTSELTLQPLKPHREAHSLQAPLEVPSQPADAGVIAYPSTSAPAFQLSGSIEATMQTTVPHSTASPIRARLSRELKPANLQIK